MLRIPFQKVFVRNTEGVKIVCENINNMRYTDHPAVITCSIVDLQCLVSRVFEDFDQGERNIQIEN